ncbi:psbP domain-containing protein 2, chloroplastic-like, partial [Dendrobium catenatum]|uniref:psbP domain-containing protein 2, chloroplastic-like n=1 Tax=Dendrobium catenatum TaxID=906689 RepID=UPI0009F5CADC
LFPASIAFSPSLSAVPLLTLERYTDEVEGFTLLKPSTWAKMEKAGAKALFEEGKGANNIGVVVNPVRLSSLKEFGTPEFVAEKLIQAERRKVLLPVLFSCLIFLFHNMFMLLFCFSLLEICR